MIEVDYITSILSRIPAIEDQLSEPAVTSNQNRFRALVAEHAALKRVERKAHEYLSLLKRQVENRELSGQDEDRELAELAAAELEEIEAVLPATENELMLALLPPDPSERRGAILELRAGTGGDEAALFGADLFRMYCRYADAQGWKVKMLNASPNDIGGYKEAIFTITGDGVYGRLQYEGGVHRVQRVPATEASGRIHTSAATLAVFPEADEEDDFELRPDEIRIDIFRSSGPGGQSVNTTDSAVRVTHLPTGTVVQCQDEKSQHRNKEQALSVLKARLLDRKRNEEAERVGDKRRELIKSGDRSDRIRTYNFPQNRLTDHRINLTLYSLDRIMEGDLDPVIDPLKSHDLDIRLKTELQSRGA